MTTVINHEGNLLTGLTGTGQFLGASGFSAPTSTPTASSVTAFDANSNLSANNLLTGFTSTATATGTTTLTVGSAGQQVFTGSAIQTCKLPAVSTLPLGTRYVITNLSTLVVTVQSSGANTIQAMATNTTLLIQSNATSGTGATVWNIIAYIPAAASALPVPMGGTGLATTTAYGVLCAGTTATGAFQSLAALGTIGSKLTSGGASALPTFKGGLSGVAAHVGSTQSFTANVATKMSANTQDLDSGSYYDHTTNFRYTPLIAGLYLFGGNATFSSQTTSTYAAIYVYKNGAQIMGNFSQAVPTGTTTIPLDICGLVSMNGSTDYLEIYVISGTASPALAATSSNLFGVLVEPT